MSEKVGIVGGTGEEGCGIALRLAAAGVEVTIGSRSADRAVDTARTLNDLLGGSPIQGTDNRTLLKRCSALFLAVPFEHASSTLADLESGFTREHLVIDVTVPLHFEKGPRLLDLDEGSGSEHLRSILDSSIPLAASFKTAPAHLLCEIDEPLDCDEFICGDSQEARDRAREIVSPIRGIRWIDAGPLRYCRALEAMTMLVIGLNRRYKSRAGRFQVQGL